MSNRASKEESEKPSFPRKEALPGSPTFRFCAAGQPTKVTCPNTMTTEYHPYGNIYSSSGTQPRFTFTGKAYNATSAMYWFPYRYYSPQMVRWISRDPMGMVDGR